MNQNPIFVACDKESHATTVQTILEESGIVNPVCWFPSGDALLNSVVDNPSRHPLLILLDADISGTPVTDLLRRLNEDEYAQSIPVVLSTNSAEDQTIKECYALGCNLYVTKPVRYEEFIHVVRALGFVLQIVRRPAAVS